MPCPATRPLRPASVLVLAAVLAAPAALTAAPPAPHAPPASRPTPTPAPPPEPAEAADSPRASLRAFLDLTRRGDYATAARYLVLPAGEEQRGPELARRLRAVLDRHLNPDLDALSPVSEESPQNGLARVDVIGQVPDGRGGRDNVSLVRTRDAAMWRFSAQTVSRVDGWYEALPDRWMREWMPAPLQRYGPGELAWWQWLAIPALLLVALAAGRLLGLATGRLLRALTRRTAARWDARLLARVSPSLTLLWATAVAALLLSRLALLPSADAWARSLLGGIATFAIFWSLWRSVDVWMQFLLERPWTAEASARSLLSVTANLVKLVVVVGGMVATLAAFGYPVVTVLAGLGIGGIALAFGAQKTIENLFGSISIAADQPFRVGDVVKIEDFTGTVERIGMRSTQVRTPDRTLITLPNGKLADMRVEDFASRDRIRFSQTVSLVLGTTEPQLREVVRETERLLRSLPKVWPDNVVARLQALGPSSIDVEVLCWFRTTDADAFRDLRQEALLGILRVVEQAGTRLAYPTQTVQLAGGGTADASGGPATAGSGTAAR